MVKKGSATFARLIRKSLSKWVNIGEYDPAFDERWVEQALAGLSFFGVRATAISSNANSLSGDKQPMVAC
jgi:hypothetical protein